MRSLLIIIAVIALLFIIRFLYQRSTPDLRKIGQYLLFGLLGALFLFLLATGRLHWLFAAVAAAIPLFFRMLPLLRYVPLLRGLYKKYQARQSGATGKAQSQTSSVRSRFVVMTLNLDSGQINGEVLEGQFRGKFLKDMTLTQLLEFLEECQNDQESLSLLAAYLDREHPEWRDQNHDSDTSHSGTNYSSSGNMSVEEACEILGLPIDATQAQIREAHRKLINRLHPDHGGSNYLAAKINLAKDTLLKRK